MLFFYQPEDYWHLPPADPEDWWAEHFDIEVVEDPLQWQKRLKKDLPDADLKLGDVAAIGDSPALREFFDSKWINPEGLVTRIHLTRTRKTPYEVACTEASARLAARAHVEAERAFQEGCSEYEIHMRYLAACQHTDAQLPYHNIVALNSNSAVLHYQHRQLAAPDRSLSFLIDAGCTFHAYASDVTRTYASEPGEFAELISAMDEMQRSLSGQVRAGLDYRDLHMLAHRKIAELLVSFKLIKLSAEDAVVSGLSGVFYPHGLGHFLGLQTHDVAGLIDNSGHKINPPDGHPFLRLTRVLEAGNVLTIEPGLYFIEPLLRNWREGRNANDINWAKVDELAPYGGIRIEDNVQQAQFFQPGDAEFAGRPMAPNRAVGGKVQLLFLTGERFHGLDQAGFLHGPDDDSVELGTIRLTDDLSHRAVGRAQVTWEQVFSGLQLVMVRDRLQGSQ